MPSLLSRAQHDGPSHPRSLPTLVLALLVTSILAYLGTPVKHSLLTSAAAWLAVLFYTTWRVGGRDMISADPAQKLAWAAGGFLSLGMVCERAVDGRGIWWAKGLLPAVIYAFVQSEVLLPGANDSPPASPDKSRMQGPIGTLPGSKTYLSFLTISALISITSAAGSNATVALGLSYASVTALAFVLVERSLKGGRYGNTNGSVIYSANGLLTQPSKPPSSGADLQLAVVRDVAMVAGVALAAAALTLESLTFGGLAYWGLLGQAMGESWVVWQGLLAMIYAIVMVVIHVVMDGALLLLIFNAGPFLSSFVPMAAAICSQLTMDFSLARLWFAAVCAAYSFLLFNEQSVLVGASTMKLRVGKMLTLISVISLGVWLVLQLRQPFQQATFGTPTAGASRGAQYAPESEPLAPLQFTDARVHPVNHLIREAEASWGSVLKSQSSTLEEAVTEYRRRYGISPPPNFDKWFAFAKAKGVQLIDDYDAIYHALLPFWGLSPATVRARAREALGFGPNNLMGLLIRDGKAKHVEGGPDWLQQAAVGMMEGFVQHLPDMDLAFNVHDEPRVVVPHDELSRLVRIALDEGMPAALANQSPRNTFSRRAKDVNAGLRISEVKTTRFNVFAHQPTWLPSRLSCSPDSPARALEESLASDNLTAYALGDLGFVYNHTAFSDVCNSPSLASSHGFFDRPNAFNVVHDLFPIFSQSKMSSFQDILYPSPWYWYGKVEYVESKDMDWAHKESRLWWRGSTTGGFSRDGGWRRQHRQLLVKKLNALDQAKILKDENTASGKDPVPDWRVKEVPRQDYKEVMDVHFSHIGQCDPGDCDAQREFFTIAPPADQQDAWKYRHLLDIDGNAFSGRFYAFLKSHSLVYKMAVFREWHEEWIRPWVHYIPLSLRGDEALESVRYFSSEPEGKEQAIRVAEQGRGWAEKALRGVDFEVWFFRLLLEYGRLVDDDRATIGYSGS